jgi:hypothetical protein
MIDGLQPWETISKEMGIPKIELAYRWIIHYSGLKAGNGDKFIADLRIDEVWKLVEAESLQE